MLTDEPVVAAYDFSSFHYLVDVGGGDGSLLLAILTKHPHLLGVVFDRPSVVERTRAAIETRTAGGVSLHCDVVAGDSFEDVPVEADVYLLNHVLRHWSDEACVTLLTNCRHSMRPDGRVLVIEQVLHPREAMPVSPFFDGQMSAQGHERTGEAYRRLFEVAGLRLTQVIATAAPYSILEGISA